MHRSAVRFHQMPDDREAQAQPAVQACSRRIRLAETLELQPGLLGLVTASWLYCRTTGDVTPRLAWLRRAKTECQDSDWRP